MSISRLMLLRALHDLRYSRALTLGARQLLGQQQTADFNAPLSLRHAVSMEYAYGVAYPQGARRTFRMTSLMLVDVEVGSFGESITEGTIASIAKRPGDAVATDEVLFQIETDKVTVDVRAPQDGIVESVLVKEDDVVKVGQVLAKIKAGAAGEAPAPVEDDGGDKADTGRLAVDEESSKPTGDAVAAAKQETTGSISSDPPPAEPARRQASIKFPPRRTPDGRQISMLPLEEQHRYLKGDAGAEQPAPAASDQQQPAQPSQQQPQAASEQQAKQQPEPAHTVFGSSTWYAGRERGTKLSQSRVLTEREMELIELGGAPP